MCTYISISEISVLTSKKLLSIHHHMTDPFYHFILPHPRGPSSLVTYTLFSVFDLLIYSAVCGLEKKKHKTFDRKQQNSVKQLSFN